MATDYIVGTDYKSWARFNFIFSSTCVPLGAPFYACYTTYYLLHKLLLLWSFEWNQSYLSFDMFCWVWYRVADYPSISTIRRYSIPKRRCQLSWNHSVCATEQLDFFRNHPGKCSVRIRYIPQILWCSEIMLPCRGITFFMTFIFIVKIHGE